MDILENNFFSLSGTYLDVFWRISKAYKLVFERIVAKNVPLNKSAITIGERENKRHWGVVRADIFYGNRLYLIR